MPGITVDISDLVDHPGATKEVTGAVEIPDLEVPLGSLEEGYPLEIELSASSIIEGVAVAGRVSGSLKLACSRCLIEFRREFVHPVDEIFYLEGRDEIYEIEGDVIDLEPMLRDVIVLGIQSPLHSPDCRGLCSTCGADLNVEDCGHSQEVEDLRWEPLKQLMTGEG